MSCESCVKVASELQKVNGCSGYLNTPEMTNLVARFFRSPEDNELGATIGQRASFFINSKLDQTIKDNPDPAYKRMNGIVSFFKEVRDNCTPRHWEDDYNSLSDYFDSIGDSAIISTLLKKKMPKLSDYTNLDSNLRNLSNIQQEITLMTFKYPNEPFRVFNQITGRINEELKRKGSISSKMDDYLIWLRSNLRKHFNEYKNTVDKEKRKNKGIISDDVLSPNDFYKKMLSSTSEMIALYKEDEINNLSQTKDELEKELTEAMPYLEYFPSLKKQMKEEIWRRTDLPMSSAGEKLRQLNSGNYVM